MNVSQMRCVRVGVAVMAAGFLLTACETSRKTHYIEPKMSPTLIGGPDVLVRDAPPLRLDQVEIGLEMEVPEPIPALRRQQMTEAAQAYGAQRGYDRKAWEIENALERRASGLSQVFDFGRVVSAGPQRVGYVIPPVVQRSFEAFQGDGMEASAADEYLVVREPGRIRAVVPSWRDWLLMDRPEPRLPPRSLLPKTKEEEALFRREFRAGWNAGEEQAVAELTERFARLGRDYEGMLQYRRLVALGMMDSMVMDQADWGVTVNKETETMRIGARTVKIVEAAAFQGDIRRWRPVPVWNGPPQSSRRLSHRGS